jgi:uncharacterized RDD family membrane protein YckC
MPEAFAPLPRPWLHPVGVRPRLVAWLLDTVFVAIWSLLPAGVAIASGGLAWNPVAMSQTDANPLATPDVPWFLVNTGPLVAAAALWVVLAIVYGAVCWTALGGLPGQRMRGLQVADARTGKNLSPFRSTLRSIVLNGIPAAGIAVALVGVIEVMAILPANATTNAALLDSGPTQSWADAVRIGALVALAWPAVLAITVAGSPVSRGLHDRISGSIVVGLTKPRSVWSAGTSGWLPYGPYGTVAGLPGEPSMPQMPWTPADPSMPQMPANPELPPTPDQPSTAEAPSTEPPSISGWTGIAPDQGRQPGAWPGIVPSERRPEAGRSDRTGAQEEPHERFRAAAFRRRMSAYAIDVIVVWAMYTLIESLLAPSDAAGNVPEERLWMLAGLVGALVQAAYFVLPWWLTGGSPGQKAMSLRVGRDVKGGRIGPIDALVRWAVLQGPLALAMATPYTTSTLLLAISVGWGILLMRSVRLDADGRGYHDRLAGSMVLEEA